MMMMMMMMMTFLYSVTLVYCRIIIRNPDFYLYCTVHLICDLLCIIECFQQSYHIPLLFMLDNQDSAVFMFVRFSVYTCIASICKSQFTFWWFFLISHACVFRIFVGSLYCATGAHFGPKMVLMSLGTCSVVVTDNSCLLC